MARKRSATALPAFSKKNVEAELKRFDFTKAIEAADHLIGFDPTDDHLAYYVRTLATCVEGFLKQGKVKSATDTLRMAEQFAVTNEPFRADVAVVLAKAGEFAKALQLANIPRVLMHIADLCVRRNRAEGAPAEIKAEFPILQQACLHYDAGRDEPAKESLQKFGLTSPFLQWKLLLRGLIAYSGNDAARAAENWQRLNPEFLPATLAAPLRATVDEAFRQSLPKDTLTSFQNQTENQFSGGVAAGLREIQKVTGRDQPLTPVWKQVEALLPKLRASHPNLVPRLGNVLYHAIVVQGTPKDMEQYRRYFPHPPDDPQFCKLQALACETTDYPDAAIEHWQKYEAWLASNPSGWSPELLARARAIVLQRIGRLVEDMNIVDEAPAELKRAMRKMIGEDDLKTNFGNPDDYYRKSLDLSPDWPDPAYDLFDRLASQKRWPAAERVATDFLARRPDDLEMLDRLFEAHGAQRKRLERLAVAQKARTVNPLDDTLNRRVTIAYIAAIRQAMIDGDFGACDRLLEEVGEEGAKQYSASFGSLRATLSRLRKQPDAVAAAEASAFAVPAGRMAAALLLVVDGTLAKLKPAQRKEAEARLKDVLAEPAPAPNQVNVLYTTWQLLAAEGFAYRGQPTHEKKIVAMVERSLKADGSEDDYETAVSLLMQAKQNKAALAMTPKLCTRFPKSPVFPFVLAQAMVIKGVNYRTETRVRRLLIDAKRLAAASAKPVHQQLLEAIEEVEKKVAPAFGGLGSLFGGSFPFGGFDDDGDDF